MTHALRRAATRAILMFHNCEGQSHKTVSTDQKLEEKEEPKRIRTEVPLLTSLTPYRQARPAHLTTENHFPGKMPIPGRYGSGKGSHWPVRATNRLGACPCFSCTGPILALRYRPRTVQAARYRPGNSATFTGLLFVIDEQST